MGFASLYPSYVLRQPAPLQRRLRRSLRPPPIKLRAAKRTPRRWGHV